MASDSVPVPPLEFSDNTVNLALNGPGNVTKFELRGTTPFGPWTNPGTIPNVQGGTVEALVTFASGDTNTFQLKDWIPIARGQLFSVEGGPKTCTL